MMKTHSFKSLPCDCGTKVQVDSHTTAVTCHMCVTKMVGIDTKSPKKDDEAKAAWRKVVAEKRAMKAEKKARFAGFPRGWHLKARYTAADGRMFQKGKEVKAFTIAEKPAIVKSGKPRGWHLKKVFVFEGLTYEYGKLVK